MITVAFFRFLNGLSHFRFKKFTMKKIAVEMQPRDSIHVGSRATAVRNSVTR